MNFLPLSRPSALRRAFTLLELLVVISIIAVLAGILLPVGSRVMDNAKKTEARSLMSSVLVAVKSYQTDYGVYPVDPGTPAAAAGAPTLVDTTFAMDSPDPGKEKGGHNYILFDVLRALNSGPAATYSSPTWKALNSRRVVYFENKDAKNITTPRSGFVPNNAGTPPAGYSVRDLVDPWGGLYCVRIDTNYSDKLVNPYPAALNAKSYSQKSGPVSDDDGTSETQVLRVPVAVWCPGKDLFFGDAKKGGEFNSTVDDVISWQ